jgi:hypothetical protein
MDIRQVLSAVPPHIERVVFPNHEAVPEGGKDSDPTTLFRKNHRTVDAAAYAQYASLARGSNPNYFLAYANGKSAARINAASDLRAHGAHRFMSSSGRETTAAETVVLHFPFRDAARAPTQICGRCYLSIAFSCERREGDPRISMPSSTPPSSNETRVEKRHY